MTLAEELETIDGNASMRIAQTMATLSIENMYPDTDTVKAWIAYERGDVSSEENIRNLISNALSK